MIVSTQNRRICDSFRALQRASNFRNKCSLPCEHDQTERHTATVGNLCMRARHAIFASIFLIPFFLVLPLFSSSQDNDRKPIDQALGWFRNAPGNLTQYDYAMTVRLRLIFFWVSKDDVGGGYIRRGVLPQDPHMELIQVLFGSDPAKAPRAINRWGAGTEISWHKAPVTAGDPAEDVTSSAFFGFMKSSRGKSVSEMKSELEREKKQGLHDFTGILTRIDPPRAVSLVVPLESTTDYTLHDYGRAEPVMLQTLADSARPVHSMDDPLPCNRAAEFLATVAELMDVGLEQHSAPVTRCYIHNAQEYSLTLQQIEPVESLAVHVRGFNNNAVLVDTTYKNMVRLDFVSTHKASARKSEFSIYTGAQGALKGVPVQIAYQPNWWFQVVLNLLPNKPTATEPAGSAH
jgi:hypothetical protein